MRVHTRINAALYPSLIDAVTEANKHGSATVYVDREMTLDDHLFIGGGTSIDGVNQGSVVLTAEPANGSWWVTCGILGYGATTANGLISQWNGSIRNIRFESGIATASTSILKVINMMTFKNITIDNVHFEAITAESRIGGISSANNAAFLNGPINKEGATISNCSGDFIQDAGNEFIGLNDASRLTITENRSLGHGDDFIAMHNCEQFEVSNNIGIGHDGRLVSESSVGGIFAGNTIKRIRKRTDNSVHQGGFLIVSLPTYTNPALRPSQDIDIVDNTCIHGDYDTPAGNLTYGIDVQGGRGISVYGNKIKRGNGLGYGVTWREFDFSTVTATPYTGDPDGLDTDSIVRVRDLHVGRNEYDADVYASGWAESVQGAVQPGPVHRHWGHAEVPNTSRLPLGRSRLAPSGVASAPPDPSVGDTFSVVVDGDGTAATEGTVNGFNVPVGIQTIPSDGKPVHFVAVDNAGTIEWQLAV